MNALRTALCSLLLLITTAPLMAQGTYTQIDVPGAGNTGAYAINNAGDITGWYGLPNDVKTYAFLFSGGTYTEIHYPNLRTTLLRGLNNTGQLVGYAIDPPGPVGFVYDIPTKTFQQIRFPGPGTFYTIPTSINDNGVIAGYFVRYGEQLGFTYSASRFKQVIPHGVINMAVTGIDGAGATVGYWSSLSGNYNFIYDGQFHALGLTGIANPMVTGINNAGSAIVGTYSPSSGTTGSFVYQNSGVTTLEFPGSTNTQATGVNDAGEVVGFFVDSSNMGHGFTWTPSVPAPKP